MSGARITRISGSLVETRPMPAASLYELVRVGERRLLGEVVRLAADVATVQVYDDTLGLRLGEPVERTGRPLTITLGPGLLGSVLDGVGRALPALAAATGSFIAPGTEAATLDESRRWAFRAGRAAGDRVGAGDVLGTVREHTGFEHRVLVPPGMEGVIAGIRDGDFTVRDAVAGLEDGRTIALAQDWPVRRARPSVRRLGDDRPFITGQRVFDFLFPVAEGGTVAVPGGFGTGKTVVEQSLARHGEADVVVYIGCGERGNEIAEVLAEFPGLADPRTGASLMDRTVLIANTSNMPVTARESSVYAGVTIAEYYRDMGYRVAVMADSISRWAESLREIGSRLQEMPGEEGYPTYLADRLGKLYERAGRVQVLGTPERAGALTLIAAVSPPGGDLSEPVTQASLRVAGALWALDAALAHQRHYPAVDTEGSYSLYLESTAEWFAARHADWPELRRWTLGVLREERELREIAGLIGVDALQDRERFLLESAHILRDAVLAQSAFDPGDARSTVEKTRTLAGLARALHDAGMAAIARGVAFDALRVDDARAAMLAVRRAADDELDERAVAARACIETLEQAA